MNATTVAEIFQKLRAAIEPPRLGDYRTADAPTASPGIRVAIGGDGTIHLLFPLTDGDAVIEDRRSESVRLVKHELLDDNKLVTFADLVCLRPELEGTFCLLAGEILAEVGIGAVRADAVARNTLKRWRELLDGRASGRLTREQLMGLFGELWTLSELSSFRSKLDCWTGPKGQRHDFRFGSTALEVKASTTTHRDVVVVHGVAQLEAPEQGELYLRRLRLDEVPSGLSVPALIERLVIQGVDRVALLGALRSCGYELEYAQEYDVTRFEVRQDHLWRVEEGFPRLIESSFKNGVLPIGVSLASYEIDLSAGQPYLVEASRKNELISTWTAG